MQTSDSTPPLLQVRGIAKRYGDQVALHEASFDLWPGEVLAIVGESGSGKTTLLNAIAARLAPDTGTVEYRAQDGALLDVHAMSEARAEAPVRAEPLEQFLQEQGAALEGLLQHEEQWARGKVRNYPPRPEVLTYRYDKQAEPAELRRRFLMALRIHPHTPLSLHVQVLPWPASQALYGSRPALAESEVVLRPEAGGVPRKYVALREGELVSVIDVLASAADEPDGGMDSGLWLDSGTEHGRVYGFGRQPRGTAVSGQGDQAPFHMGLFHESPVTYASADGLRRTYAEYRMHLWQSLARHALVNEIGRAHV